MMATCPTCLGEHKRGEPHFEPYGRELEKSNKPAPTPEEIAEGLTDADAGDIFALLDLRSNGGSLCSDADIDALVTRGWLVENEHGTTDWTDIGRAVADVLAKRGAR